MKAFRFFGMALLAVALCFTVASCSDDDDSSPSLGSNVTVSGAKLCSGQMPCAGASSVALSSPSTVTSGSGLSLTSTEQVATFYMSLLGKNGYYEIPVSNTRAAGQYTYVIVVTVSGSENVTVSVSAQTVSGQMTPAVSVVVVPVGGGETGGGNTTTTDKAPSGVVAVDLGLPSGTKWANMNIGADSPEDYGDYFAWGETKGYNGGKTNFSWSTYKWCNGSYDSQTKYCVVDGYGTVDYKTELDPADDAAYVNWGKDWRMPSNDQIIELKEKCSWSWTTKNGVYGYCVTGTSGNSIFLPASGSRYDSSFDGAGSYGYYWSRSLYLDKSYIAFEILFDSGYVGAYYCDRYYGRSVRPVRGAQK